MLLAESVSGKNLDRLVKAINRLYDEYART